MHNRVCRVFLVVSLHWVTIQSYEYDFVLRKYKLTLDFQNHFPYNGYLGQFRVKPALLYMWRSDHEKALYPLFGNSCHSTADAAVGNNECVC